MIGPNQSGKTNLLDALDLLKQSADGRLNTSLRRTRGGLRGLLWARDGCDELRYTIVVEDPAKKELPLSFLSYELALIDSRQGYEVWEESLTELPEPAHITPTSLFSLSCSTGAYVDFNGNPSKVTNAFGSNSETFLAYCRPPLFAPRFYPLADHFRRFLIYPGFNTSPLWTSDSHDSTIEMRKPQYLSSENSLDVDGTNLVNVLYTLKQDNTRWSDFTEMVRTGFPDFETIDFPPDAGAGRVALAWIDGRFPKKKFYADVLSSGTLCFLALAAALAAPEEPRLIAIDEPEQHLHPELLYRLVGLLEQASAKHQIIVTTHSDALLSFLSDPTSVVLVENGKDGTKFTRPPEADLREWLKAYSLGELRESGHLSAFSNSDS